MNYSPAVLNDVDVRDGLRIVTATVDGVRYQIPEMWLVGACQTRTVLEAVRHWHEQAELERGAVVGHIGGKPAEEATVTPSLIGKTLRRFSAAGPCLTYAYGTIVKYSNKTVTFRTDKGELKRAGGYDWHSDGTRPLGEGLLHAGPCPSCMDHAQTQYPNGYMD